MKKIYIDVFGTRVSGQLLMQQNLKKEVQKRGMYAEAEDADYLVYVQLPCDFNIDTWKKYKAQGKKIVFIHHYFEKFESFNIFKIPGALELVDLNICISRKCETYRYLRKRLGKNAKIAIHEQVCVDQKELFARYFNFDTNKKNTICFVGRVNKGVYDFIDYCEKNCKLLTYKKTIYTTGKDDEIQKLKDYLLLNDFDEDFEIVLDKQRDQLYHLFSENRFVYMNADMNASENHFETVMHEAMATGVVVVLGENQRRYITAKDSATGFVTKDFDFESSVDESKRQILQYKYLKTHFDDEETVMEKNINAILNCK